jgi:cytochrome c oxidase cbb3-type subunit 1
LWSAAGWAAFLVLDGFALFLPGALERMKFTNALVAHSHLAMAGMLTSLNFLMLISLAPRSRVATALAAPRPWLAWNLAALGMVVVLTVTGWREGHHPRLIADGDIGVTAAYLARLLAGAVMLGVSARWWRATVAFPGIRPKGAHHPATPAFVKATAGRHA